MAMLSFSRFLMSGMFLGTLLTQSLDAKIIVRDTTRCNRLVTVEFRKGDCMEMPIAMEDEPHGSGTMIKKVINKELSRSLREGFQILSLEAIAPQTSTTKRPTSRNSRKGNNEIMKSKILTPKDALRKSTLGNGPVSVHSEGNEKVLEIWETMFRHLDSTQTIGKDKTVIGGAEYIKVIFRLPSLRKWDRVQILSYSEEENVTGKVLGRTSQKGISYDILLDKRQQRGMSYIYTKRVALRCLKKIKIPTKKRRADGISDDSERRDSRVLQMEGASNFPGLPDDEQTRQNVRPLHASSDSQASGGSPSAPADVFDSGSDHGLYYAIKGSRNSYMY